MGVLWVTARGRAGRGPSVNPSDEDYLEHDTVALGSYGEAGHGGDDAVDWGAALDGWNSPGSSLIDVGESALTPVSGQDSRD